MADQQKPAPIPKLSTGGLKAGEYSHVAYDVTPGHAVTAEMLLEPSYWGHVAAKLRPLDEIRAVPVDGSWYARFLVLRADNVSASLKQLEYHALDIVKAEDMETDSHEVKWAGPHAKHRILRKSDNEVIRAGFETKQAAIDWMNVNLKALAA